MENRSYVSTLSSVSLRRASPQVILLLPILAVWIATNAHAASATWDLNPSNGDWNTAANWTPPTVPNGPSDTASFAVSNIAAVSLSSDTEVGSITFDSGASEFNIIVSPLRTLTISGDGISNNSDISENFSIVVDSVSNTGTMIFTHSATAGNMTTFTNEANVTDVFAFGASTRFRETSSADHGTFINNGAATSDAFGGVTEFFAESSAANATIFNQPGLVQGAHGGTTFVLDVAHADKATFISNGANVSGADGGNTTFSHRSRADNATLIANAGVNGGGGGQIVFAEASSGAASRVELFGNGFLDLSMRFSGNGIRIGSIEGDGVVILGTEPLKVGSNSLSTLFSGVIQSFGAITKVGGGTLTLTGANTYTGGTTVTGGTLKINNRSGSGTGTGAVSVSGGALSGGGTISGAVTIGTGSGTGAILDPGKGASRPVALTIQSQLTFQTDGTYTYRLNTKRAQADQVVANGVTLESGAQFSFVAVANKRLTAGTVFTAMNNTSANPISGTFVNLPDGSTFTAGRNSYQVSYSGGDGNDLTLTVVP